MNSFKTICSIVLLTVTVLCSSIVFADIIDSKQVVYGNCGGDSKTDSGDDKSSGDST